MDCDVVVLLEDTVGDGNVGRSGERRESQIKSGWCWKVEVESGDVDSSFEVVTQKVKVG